MAGTPLKRYPAGSSYYVRAMVRGQPVDLDTDSVDIALLQDGPPQNGDWRPAKWQKDRGVVYARILVGCATYEPLDEGAWQVWLRVKIADEAFVRLAGTIDVT
jgi:hypothetical protein